MRQWRKENITIAPPPSNENSSSQNDIWAIELPHGMPKDSHLLPQHSQDLLRAARSGKIYAKRPAPVEEEEVDPEVILGDKPDKKEDDTKIQGYTVKTWKQIPRHLEGPDIEYLAKRRKHLKTVASKPTGGPTLTKATVKRTDATGTEYLQDVVVAPGQQIEGEVVSQTTIPDPNAQPVDPYAVAPTPPKKKGPVIRKKAKGPGRGRKKKQVAPTSAPAAPPVPGAAPIAEGAVGAAIPEVSSVSHSLLTEAEISQRASKPSQQMAPLRPHQRRMKTLKWEMAQRPLRMMKKRVRKGMMMMRDLFPIKILLPNAQELHHLAHPVFQS